MQSDIEYARHKIYYYLKLVQKFNCRTTEGEIIAKNEEDFDEWSKQFISKNEEAIKSIEKNGTPLHKAFIAVAKRHAGAV